jgi:hypothetical protein
MCDILYTMYLCQFLTPYLVTSQYGEPHIPWIY